MNNRIGRLTVLMFVAISASLVGGCGGQFGGDVLATGGKAVRTVARVSYYTPEIVAEYPHDPQAFTQGLVFHDGYLYESTGLYGQSSLRQVDLTTGHVLRSVSVPGQYFAEGLTLFGDRLHQLTWQEGKAFIYDPVSLVKVGEWSYEGEGWGLTNNNKHLIMSDGTSVLRFINPQTYQVERTVVVRLDGQPLVRLNELEHIHGEIYANVWQTNNIVRIDPETGDVRGVIDCGELVSRAGVTSSEDVLNGIAYDPASDRLFVTGKRWSKLFEVRLVKILGAPGTRCVGGAC